VAATLSEFDTVAIGDPETNAMIETMRIVWMEGVAGLRG